MIARVLFAALLTATGCLVALAHGTRGETQGGDQFLDGIGETGHSKSQTRLMRTQPLWGARFNERFLHDGRAGNIQEAIQAHDGQGAAARDAFNTLDSADQHALIQFVRSL